MTATVLCDVCGKTEIRTIADEDDSPWQCVTAPAKDAPWLHLCSWLCVIGLAIEEGQLTSDEVIDILVPCGDVVPAAIGTPS